MVSYTPSGPLTAQLFGDSLPDGRSRVDVTSEPGALVAITADGQRYRLASHDITLSLGGDRNRHWYVATESLTLVSEHPDLPDLLAHLDPELAMQVANLRQQHTRKRHGGRLGCLLGIGLLVVAILTLPTCYRWGVEQAAEALPDSIDTQLGELGWSQMGASLVEHPDPEVQAAVLTMLERLQPVLDEPERWDLQVSVIKDDTVNAFAMPGGRMVIFTGLMAAAEHPDEVAAVLAHEIGHVIERHGVKRLAHLAGVSLGVQLLLGDVAGLMALAPQLIQLLTANDYSREQEREADRIGVELMHRAGLNPYALADFFQRLQEEGNEAPAFLAWLSTHPPHAERIALVEAVLAELGPQPELPVLDLDWVDIKHRLASPTTEHQDDEPTPSDNAPEPSEP